MAVFTYMALDPQARAQQGTIAADTPSLARQALRERGLAILRIDPARSSRRVGRSIQRRRIAVDERAEMWRSLAVLLRSGVPLAAALDVCRAQQRGALAVVLRELGDQVRSGTSLAAALAVRSEIIDRIGLVILEVGEGTGKLAEALKELADYELRRHQFGQRLGTALIYPGILCIVGTAVTLFLMTYVVPQLTSVLASAGRDLPLVTQWLRAFSNGLGNYLFIWILLVATLIAAFITMYRHPTGRRAIERLILRIPGLGALFVKNRIAQLCMLLGALLRADVRFLDALRTVRTGLPTGLMVDELEKVERAVEAGASIASPLQDSRLIPPMVVQLLAIGQESGELPALLTELRDTYDREVQVALTRFLAVLEPLLIIILAIVIGFVAYATLLPILEATRIIQ